MIFDLGLCLVLYLGITFGLAWPVARRFPLEPVEKVATSTALSLLLVFITGWTVYVLALSLKFFWTLPALALIGMACEWRTVISAFKDAEVRTLLAAQILVTAWSVGLLALILSYSGGVWVADWWGHLQRVSFFLDRGPPHILFNGFDALTSRPPLANVVTGVFMQITHRDFSHYQFFSTLFASLTFLPAGLLARRFGGKAAVPVLAVLFMANPMFAQNVTFSWTKLPAAFFILTALYFFLRSNDQKAPVADAILFAITLSAGLLTHYSAGPYAIILGISWVGLGWPYRNDPSWRRMTGFAVLAGALVLITWFGWCLSVYGIRGTLLTNSSITDKSPDVGVQLRTVILNIRDTLVPHFLRDVNSESIAQTNSIGRLRDWFFQVYQLNFIFVFGCVAWFAITFRLILLAQHTTRVRRIFWSVFIIGNGLLGVAVHGAREPWGLAHICLQPLVIVGLAFLAAQWPVLTRPWRIVLIVGATLDFVAGIGLQLAVESFAFERWLAPNRTVYEIVAGYSRATEMNFSAKMQCHWPFLGDRLIDYGYAIVGFLILVILSAVRSASSRAKIQLASPES